MGKVNMRMELRQDPGGPELGWDLSANTMVELIGKARAICEQHDRKFSARDVLVWDNQENLAAKKKSEPAAAKPKKEKVT